MIKGVNYNNIILPDKGTFNKHGYVFEAPIITNGLVLKFYSMYEGVQPLDFSFINKCKNFIEERIRTNGFSFERGIGVAIVSDGFINVNRWWKEYASVPIPILYGFEEENLEDYRTVDPKKDGAYCLWEAEIIAEEGKLWKNINNKEGIIPGLNKPPILTKEKKIDKYLETKIPNSNYR